MQEILVNPKYPIWHPQPPSVSARRPISIKKDMELRPMRYLTNPDEDYFSESLLTLLNGKQDLQKQSFNIDTRQNRNMII